MDNCPTCERKFDKISDFPLVYIAGVSFLKPDEVPQGIPNWRTEELLEKKIEKWNRELVPSEVLSYFKDNPDSDELIHTDGFIYNRPYEDTKGFIDELRGHEQELPKSPINPKFWRKSRNDAQIVKKLLEENKSVKHYFEALEQMVGRKIRPAEIMPTWNPNANWKIYPIPNAEGILAFNDAKERTNKHRVTEIELLSKEDTGLHRFEQTFPKILSIGYIEYEGRVHHKICK